MLSKLNIAGHNGQFRTPRHIIRLMVDLVEPKPDWTIGDPACGTAGFLVARDGVPAGELHLAQGHPDRGRDGETFQVYTGDLLEPYRDHIRSGMFHGYDFDVDDAPHRGDEPDAPRRRQPAHPLQGHAERAVRQGAAQGSRRTAST